MPSIKVSSPSLSISISLSLSPFFQHTPSGAVKAAVKTLKDNFSSDDKRKFLQEAAIMGQFKHRNVVEIYGVVEEGGPVWNFL